ncbi:MAG: amino acid permease [Candidatus Kapabacteria bacterium]|nr:amino acid permease [Candidatus Kapabacteria bacterium]
MSFKRELGLFDATMIVAGSMIGSGVFIVSADIARTVGSPGMLLLVWLLTGVLTLTAALSYGELAGLLPHAGGQYVYLREAFGPFAGFLYGWTLFTVIQTGTIAAVGMAFAKYTSAVLPIVGESNVLLSIGGDATSPGFSVNAAQVFAILSIVFLTALNARGVSLGKIIQNTFTTTKIVSVVALAVAGIVYGVSTGSLSASLGSLWTDGIAPIVPNLTPGQQESYGFISRIGMPFLAAVAVAMVGSVFSSDAWNNITFAAAEVKDPERTIPRALVIGVSLVTVLYLLTNLSYIAVMPIGGSPDATTALDRGIAFATNDRVGAAAAEVIFGTSGGVIMAVLIMISTFGCNNGIILSGSRAYYAMANDGMFFRQAALLNRNGAPAASLWMQAIWASVLCLSGKYGDLLDYVVFAVLLFYVLTILGIMRLRATRPDAPRPIKAVGYPVLPALYIVLALAICVCLLIYKPNYSWPGLLIVASGVPVYALWRR